jgi:hypothetical protein
MCENLSFFFFLSSLFSWKFDHLSRQAWDRHDEYSKQRDRCRTAFMQVAEGNAAWWQYAKPGHYNDPDDVALGAPGPSTSFWCHLILKPENLPRQAQDKHRKTWKKEKRFGRLHIRKECIVSMERTGRPRDRGRGETLSRYLGLATKTLARSFPRSTSKRVVYLARQSRDKRQEDCKEKAKQKEKRFFWCGACFSAGTWAMMKAPFVLSVDFARNSARSRPGVSPASEADWPHWILPLVLNPDLIGISQDPLSVQAHRLWSSGATTRPRPLRARPLLRSHLLICL